MIEKINNLPDRVETGGPVITPAARMWQSGEMSSADYFAFIGTQARREAEWQVDQELERRLQAREEASRCAIDAARRSA